MENSTKGCFIKSSISLLALANQIDEKYKNEAEQLKALKYLNKISIYCIYNNQTINNSTCIGTLEDTKMFLNGALDYIIKETPSDN